MQTAIAIGSRALIPFSLRFAVRGIGVLLICTIGFSSVFAQSPEKLSYQAVIRDASNHLVANSPVGMKTSILQGSATGNAVYVEIYNPNPVTNVNGLVALEIGGGIPVSGTFANINWANGPYFIKTETDPSGGTNYTVSGTSQLLSVPYALHAKTAEVVGDHTHGNLTNDGKIGAAEGRIITTGQGGNLLATPGMAAGEMLYWNGSAWVNVAPGKENQVLTFKNGVPTWTNTLSVGDIGNPATGKIWMDRNLGAGQVAISSTDIYAYGYLYQWGRGNDGHQLRTSGTTTTLSSSNTPGHDDFILAPLTPFDWRSPQNDNLWQGLNGINNPCPSGYRLPTAAEWDAERQSWSSNNAAGALASPLKLTMGGGRSYSHGGLVAVGNNAYYWSSTINGSNVPYLFFSDSQSYIEDNGLRAAGRSVRCIKD
jgi:uncharacterized protein (TIGR02145 family)